MLVEARLGDADMCRDLIHRHEVEAFLRQQMIDSVQNRGLPESKLLLFEGGLFLRCSGRGADCLVHGALSAVCVAQF